MPPDKDFTAYSFGGGRGRPETTIDFVDDDSFSDLQNMDRLRQLLAERLPDRKFRFFVRSDTVARNPDHFQRWAESGLRFASVGLESFRKEELRDYHKSATVEQNLKAIEILKDAGIGIIGFVIINPNFLLDDFERVGDTVEQLGLEHVVYDTLTPYPGTLLYEQMKDQLITTNWEHFDGFRAVVETALPRREYYHQLANLYRRAYAGSGNGHDRMDLPWFEELARAIEATEDEHQVKGSTG